MTPNNVNTLSTDLQNVIYSFDNTYREIYNLVIRNFYNDIFQNSKVLNSKVINKSVEGDTNCWMNVIGAGADDMARMYWSKKTKREKDLGNYISSSCYVS